MIGEIIIRDAEIIPRGETVTVEGNPAKCIHVTGNKALIRRRPWFNMAYDDLIEPLAGAEYQVCANIALDDPSPYDGSVKYDSQVRIFRLEGGIWVDQGLVFAEIYGGNDLEVQGRGPENLWVCALCDVVPYGVYSPTAELIAVGGGALYVEYLEELMPLAAQGDGAILAAIEALGGGQTMAELVSAVLEPSKIELLAKKQSTWTG